MIVWRTVNPLVLEPVFRQDLIDLLEPHPSTWYMLWGFRTGLEQSKLWLPYKAYLDGTGPKAPKAAPPGNSPHEYGLAVDLVPDQNPDLPGLQPEWNTAVPAWQWLFEAAHRHPRLKSGKAFDDSDHLEAFPWRARMHWRDA